MLGWLLCKHWDEENQGTELWHIVNPELRDTVPREKVLAVWNQIIYVAVDLNEKLISSKKDSQYKKDSIAYHNKIRQNRMEFVQKLEGKLDREVTKE